MSIGTENVRLGGCPAEGAERRGGEGVGPEVHHRVSFRPVGHGVLPTVRYRTFVAGGRSPSQRMSKRPQPQSATHGKTSRKFNRGCTICRSCCSARLVIALTE